MRWNRLLVLVYFTLGVMAALETIDGEGKNGYWKEKSYLAG